MSFATITLDFTRPRTLADVLFLPATNGTRCCTRPQTNRARLHPDSTRTLWLPCQYVDGSTNIPRHGGVVGATRRGLPNRVLRHHQRRGVLRFASLGPPSRNPPAGEKDTYEALSDGIASPVLVQFALDRSPCHETVRYHVTSEADT